MVVTSDQISMMAGNFQMQTINQMQHAAMISQQVGSQPFGEAAMGRLTNMGAGIGAPVLAGGMALAGLDPFSMALRGGMMGAANFGMMGGIAGGMAGAGLIGLPMMAAQYAGSQMLGGMQQQQQLNSALRQQYQFINSTGRGFNQGQMGDIGQLLRSTSMTPGPGGEFSSMEELSRMAISMGQMGMAGNVHNVRDFTEKFRKMMKEVKEVATAFHTSLEEAQQIMGSMRSSGIFSNQGQVAQQIRNTAMGGGLATSEVTSMMNIGSQISRAIGGRGQAGAMGGMLTIGQIGGALQSGVLSEEDIYNATGLTGAEGRQAMASSMMQRSARFLRGGLGRRFLASVAGKDGSLDASSVEAYMYGGGIGTDDTMGMAYGNLGKVGRANFIRNEGRLRGAALEKFGGNVDLMVMKGWLEQRGIDSGGDRAKIFMSRRLGIGQEELDEQLKLLNNMPQIMREQEMAGLKDQRFGRLELMRSNTGLSGIKKSFERARHDLNSRLQQAGADLYQSGSNVLERWANELTNQFMVDMSENIESSIQEVLQGGAGAERTLATRFGIGKGIRGGGALGQQYRNEMFGRQGSVGALTSAERAGDLKRMSWAGYNITAVNDKQFASEMKFIRGLGSSFREGNDAVGGLDTSARNALRSQLAMGGLRGGMGGQSDFEDMLRRSDNPKLRALADRFAQGNANERAAMMGTLTREVGMGSMGSASVIAPDEQAVFGQGGFRTADDRNLAIGDYMLKNAGDNAAYRNQKVAFGKTRGELLGGLAGTEARKALMALPGGLAFALSGIGRSVEREAGTAVRGMYDESAGGIGVGVRKAMGSYLTGEEGQRLSRGALSLSSEESAKAMEAVTGRLGTLQARAGKLAASGGELSRGERGEMEGLKSIMVAQEFMNLRESLGDEEAAAKVAGMHGISAEDVMSRAKGVVGTMVDDQTKARKELMERAQKAGADRASLFRGAGIMKGGRLSAAAVGKAGQIGAVEQMSGKGISGDLARIGSGGSAADVTELLKSGSLGMTTGQRFWAGLVGSASALEQINQYSADDPRNAQLLQKSIAFRRDSLDTLGRMGDKEVTQMGKLAREWGDVDSARLISEHQGIRRRLARAGGGVRGDIILSETLGSGVSRKDIAMQHGNIDAVAGLIGRDMLGSAFATSGESEGADAYRNLKKALEAQRAGRTGEAAETLRQLRSSDVVADARREKQDEQAAQDDPRYRALGKIENAIKDMGEKFTTTLSKTLSVNVQNLADLKKKKDPE